MQTLDGIRSIDELELANQRLFIRVDFDVPVAGGRVGSDERIRAALPTIRHALAAGARVVLATERGQPGGHPNGELGLEPVAARLSELLESDVYLPDDCIGDAARKVVQDLRPGQLCLLENLGFYAEEAARDEAFARKLAAYADVYVNEAPRAASVPSASIQLVPRFVRERGMGLLFRSEFEALSRLATRAEPPFVAVLGGSRVAERLALFQALLGRASAICAGGMLGNTLLEAGGIKTQASGVERELLPRARAALAEARQRRVEVLLPTDVVVADDPAAATGAVFASNQIPDGGMALDLGPNTIRAFSARIESGKSVWLVGPLGAAENPAFAGGTREILESLGRSSAFRVVSGASLTRAVRDAGDELGAKIGFVSTLGDAALDFLQGRRFPGLEALRGGAT